MTRKQYAFALISLVISGFFGGMLSGGVFAVRPSLAEIKSAELIEAKDLIAENIVAEKILLYNDKKEIRAILRVMEGDPILQFLDQNEKVRLQAKLTVDGDPAISFYEKNEKISAYFGKLATGDTGLTLFRGGADPTVILSSGGVGGRQSSIEFGDEKGTVRAVLGMQSNGVPVFGFADKNGLARAELTLKTDSEDPIYNFWNHRGKLTISLGNFPPGLQIFEGNKTPRAFMGLAGEEGVSVILGDKDGKVIWSAP